MKHHPEQRDPEIYMGNTLADGFRLSSWTTKRMGQTPLMADGSPFNHATELRPWFIKRSEVERALTQQPEAYQPLLEMLNSGRIDL
jgi:hypothetical protein